MNLSDRLKMFAFERFKNVEAVEFFSWNVSNTSSRLLWVLSILSRFFIYFKTNLSVHWYFKASSSFKCSDFKWNSRQTLYKKLSARLIIWWFNFLHFCKSVWLYEDFLINIAQLKTVNIFLNFAFVKSRNQLWPNVGIQLMLPMKSETLNWKLFTKSFVNWNLL